MPYRIHGRIIVRGNNRIGLASYGIGRKLPRYSDRGGHGEIPLPGCKRPGSPPGAGVAPGADKVCLIRPIRGQGAPIADEVCLIRPIWEEGAPIADEVCLIRPLQEENRANRVHFRSLVPGFFGVSNFPRAI